MGVLWSLMASTQAALSRVPPAFPFTWVTRPIPEYHQLVILLW